MTVTRRRLLLWERAQYSISSLEPLLLLSAAAGRDLQKNGRSASLISPCGNSSLSHATHARSWENRDPLSQKRLILWETRGVPRTRLSRDNSADAA